jgi:hypothetical protein
MPSLIKDGVSASSRKRLIELASKNSARQPAGDRETAVAKGAQIEAAQTRFREAFWKQIDSHPEGAKIRKESGDAINALRELVGKKFNKDDREKVIVSVREALDQIEKRRKSAISTAAKNAINQDKYVAAMLKAIKRKPVKLKKGTFGGLSMSFEPDLRLLNLRFPTQTSFTLEPPFDPNATVTELTSVDVGAAFPADGSIFVSAFAEVAGYQMNRAQVGAFLTIPSGFSTLTLQARILDVDADVWAFALGAAWASSGLIAEVTSTADSSVTRRETTINFVVAPLLFYARDEFTGPKIMNAEFPISRQGGEILVTAGLKCDVWAAVVAASTAFVSGVTSKITVKVS